MSARSSRGKGCGGGKGKGGTKGEPVLWEGSIGPKIFEEALYERFPVESKSDFNRDAPLRGYDDHKEEWPKYMLGEECLVQMYTKGIDGGRRFFKCPRAWVIDIKICCFNMLLLYSTTYTTHLLQAS
jgi:hypothetical protein